MAIPRACVARRGSAAGVSAFAAIVARDCLTMLGPVRLPARRLFRIRSCSVSRSRMSIATRFMPVSKSAIGRNSRRGLSLLAAEPEALCLCLLFARMYGVKSAMPMFKALKACPDAVVIRPDFEKYTAASRAVRTLMDELTPLVLPLSIDEAVMDLSGTEALHGAPPAVVLARFALRVEQQVGITVSIGLAANRLMGKIAAGRNKPRGFAVIGADEARGFLANEPVRLLPGIGPALARKLDAMGITNSGIRRYSSDRDALPEIG